MIDDDTTAHGGNNLESDGGARQRAINAYEEGRDSVAGTLGQAPLLALAGGIAAGALIAALLPRTQGEARLVRPYARRAKDGARAAYTAAKDTGSNKLGELGLTRDKGEETIRNLLHGLGEAARASADAAMTAVRKG